MTEGDSFFEREWFEAERRCGTWLGPAMALCCGVAVVVLVVLIAAGVIGH